MKRLVHIIQVLTLLGASLYSGFALSQAPAPPAPPSISSTDGNALGNYALINSCITQINDYNTKKANLAAECSAQLSNTGSKASTPSCQDKLFSCIGDAKKQVNDIGASIAEERISDESEAKTATDAGEKPEDLTGKNYCLDKGGQAWSVKIDPKTPCSNLTADQQASLLKSDLKDLNSKADETSKDFDSAEKDAMTEAKDCQKQQATIAEQLTKAEFDLKSASSEEMTELQGVNVKLTQTLNNLQAQVDQATIELAEINGPEMTAAMNQYQAAIAKAQVDCHSNLVKQGASNSLTYQNLQEAVNASQVGLTTYKCDRDFEAQVARSLALQTLNQQRQALQAKFLHVQAKIAALNRDVSNQRKGASVEQQGLIIKFTNRIAADNASITSLTQQQQNARAACQKEDAFANQKLTNTKGKADKSLVEALSAQCQLDALKAAGHPGNESLDYTAEQIKKLQDKYINLPTDPCQKEIPPSGDDPGKPAGFCSAIKSVCPGNPTPSGNIQANGPNSGTSKQKKSNCTVYIKNCNTSTQ